MTVEQLLLFHMPRTELERIADELAVLKNNQDKLRRGLFRRQGELAFEVNNMQSQIDMFTMQLYTLEAYVRQRVDEMRKYQMTTKEK